MEKFVDGDIREVRQPVLPNECDLENYAKNLEKIKTGQKVINNALIIERERKLYFEQKGYFPVEFPEGSEGHYQWVNSIERSRYVKKLTEGNETSTAKKPSRARKKKKAKPKESIPWSPPPH